MFGVCWLSNYEGLKAGLTLHVALKISTPNSVQFGIKAPSCIARKIKKSLDHSEIDSCICLVRFSVITFCRSKISSNPFGVLKVCIKIVTDHKFSELAMMNQDKIHQNRTQNDRCLRVDVAEFTGQSLKPKDYINWETNLENYFEFKDTPLDKQFKMAKVKLTKLAATWLEGV